MQYLSLVLCLHLQSLTDCKVPLSQGPGYVWRWLLIVMISDWGLIKNEIRDWAGSKADSALKWNRVLVSAAKVRWPELSQLSLCSAFDKENSMEFSLISLLLIHFYYCGYALALPWSSCYSCHVTHCDCDMTWPSVTIHHTIVTLWQSHMILSHTPSCSYKSNKKRNINNDLAVLPSHNNLALEHVVFIKYLFFYLSAWPLCLTSLVLLLPLYTSSHLWASVFFC